MADQRRGIQFFAGASHNQFAHRLNYMRIPFAELLRTSHFKNAPWENLSRADVTPVQTNFSHLRLNWSGESGFNSDHLGNHSAVPVME